jgi:excisionase family DNA binding protein
MSATSRHPAGRPELATPARRRFTRDDVLDGREVAALLGLPMSTVLEYARRGLLPAHKLGRRWLFLRDEIEDTVRGKTRIR